MAWACVPARSPPAHFLRLTDGRLSLRLDGVDIRGRVDFSHSNGFKPDTLDVFPDTVRKFTFKFAKSKWDSLMKAMTDSCGKFGSGQVNYGGTGLEFIEDGATIRVPADMYADGQVWKNIAIRLKGNGSLRTAWTKGNYTLPFRINTDKFEDTYPEIKNQRFHGFNKLTFYTSDQDSSSIRASIASEVFRESGDPKSDWKQNRTGFYSEAEILAKIHHSVLSAYCGSAKNCLEMTDQDLRVADGFTYGRCSGGILQYRKGDSVYLYYLSTANHKSRYFSTGWSEMFCAPDRLIAFFGTRGYFTIYDYPFNSGIQGRKYTPKEDHQYYQPPVKLTKISDSTYALQDQTQTIFFHRN